MVRCVFVSVLALQLLLPGHALHQLAAAFKPVPAAEPVSKPEPKVCPCTGKVGCKCCGCDDDEPEPEASAKKSAPDKDSGPHGALRCPCKAAEDLASLSVYLPNAAPQLLTLCQPQQEPLLGFAEYGPSLSMPIRFPPTKIRRLGSIAMHPTSKVCAEFPLRGVVETYVCVARILPIVGSTNWIPLCRASARTRFIID